MGLRPRFKTPFSQARDKLVSYAIRPFMMFEPRTRFFILFGLLVLLTTLLLQTSHSSGLNENYKEGDVLTRAIIAPADITTIDLGETEQRRAAARRATRPVLTSTPAAPKRLYKASKLAGKNSKNKRPRDKPRHPRGLVKVALPSRKP